MGQDVDKLLRVMMTLWIIAAAAAAAKSLQRTFEEKDSIFFFFFFMSKGLPSWLSGKESTAGDESSIRGLGTSHGEENGHPLQYTCLENPMDRRIWRATVHGDAKELDTI